MYSTFKLNVKLSEVKNSIRYRINGYDAFHVPFDQRGKLVNSAQIYGYDLSFYPATQQYNIAEVDSKNPKMMEVIVNLNKEIIETTNKLKNFLLGELREKGVLEKGIAARFIKDDLVDKTKVIPAHLVYVNKLIEFHINATSKRQDVTKIKWKYEFLNDSLKIEGLTKEMLRLAVKEKVEEKDYSVLTVKQLLTAIKSALRYLGKLPNEDIKFDEEGIYELVVADVIPSNKILNNEHYINTLNDAEIDKIINTPLLDLKLDNVRKIAAIGLSIGMRQGDLNTLLIDHEDKLSYDEKGRCWIKFDTAKTGEYVKIPITPKIEKYIRSATGIPVYLTYKRNLVTMLKALGITRRIKRLEKGKRVVDGYIYEEGTHLIRRSFCTHWLLKGIREPNSKITPEVIRTISGHKTTESFKAYVGISVREEKINVFAEELYKSS